MIRSLLALAPLALALAAAASAQTVVLQPAAAGSYAHTFVNDVDMGFGLTSASQFFSGANLSWDGPLVGDPGHLHFTGNKTLEIYGWRAEFDVPATPSGARLASALLKVRGNPQGDTRVGSYTGSGTITATDSGSSIITNQFGFGGNSLSLDVTGSLGVGRYAGFDVSGVFYPQTPLNAFYQWFAPTLVLTYAPVPEPSALAALGLGALGLLRRRKA